MFIKQPTAVQNDYQTTSLPYDLEAFLACEKLINLKLRL